MRQQLIDWIVDEIMPEIQKNGKPEATMLKFASERNLAPGLLEGLGHLFNTAKTLSFFEKAANRGATFPILDVPSMVDTYMEVRTTKQAAVFVAPENEALADLPSCFLGLLRQPVKLATVNDPSSINLRKLLCEESIREQSQLLVMLKQARFEEVENMRITCEKVATKLRQNPDMPFEQVEQDAVYVMGDPVKPFMDKLATFLGGMRVRVKRASNEGPKRLVMDDAGFLPLLQQAWETQFRIEAADEMTKEATAALEELSRDAQNFRPKRGLHAPKPRTSAPGDTAAEVKPKSQHGGAAPKKGEPPAPAAGGKPHGKPTGTYFGHVNSAMDSAAQPILRRFMDAGEKAFLGRDNKPQRHVDTNFQDARHLAVLQNLLTTDDVLANADHDKVIDVFNTLRQNSPHLAGDTNTARVILRSAVQHDGISPFDLKGFLDTESAKQKVDINHRQLDAHLYKGKELPGSRPASA